MTGLSFNTWAEVCHRLLCALAVLEKAQVLFLQLGGGGRMLWYETCSSGPVRSAGAVGDAGSDRSPFGVGDVDVVFCKFMAV